MHILLMNLQPVRKGIKKAPLKEASHNMFTCTLRQFCDNRYTTFSLVSNVYQYLGI
jgi:hypothetical protein